VQDSMARIRLEIVPKIKALCWRNKGVRSPAAPLPAQNPGGTLRAPNPSASAAASAVAATGSLALEQRIDIVAIGTSTGGPNALAEVMPHIPADFPVPIVIVQHMPPTFTRFLAERLTASSPLLVREGVSGTALEPGQAWIAPGDYHMNLRREDGAVRLGVFQAPPENSCRPSVDVLFRSVAEIYRQNVLGVVMTGMGQDGLRGCEHIKEAHGRVIVQDEATSVVWGMPGFVAKAGLADCILPLPEIADEIVRRVNRGRRALPYASQSSARARLEREAQGGEYGN